MTVPLGLTASQQAALGRALVKAHPISKPVVQILDLSHRVLNTVSDRVQEGQVQIDSTGENTRSASMVLLDPSRSLSLDSMNPAAGASYGDNMVRIQYPVYVTELARWVFIPVFTGPVATASRADELISIEAVGKEAMRTFNPQTSNTYVKGTNKVAMIRDLLLKAGEASAYLDLPANAAKQPVATVISPESNRWEVAQQVARGMGLQLFYDGRGIVRLRPLPSALSWTFRGGEGGSLSTSATFDYDSSDRKNGVWVKGGTPAGSSRAISHFKWLPSTHPLSKESLASNGVPRALLEIVEDDTITTTVAAETVATNTLAAVSAEAVSFAFDALPVPFLEPGDLACLTTDTYTGTFRVTNLTIPLNNGLMAVGYGVVPSRPGVVSNAAAMVAAQRAASLRAAKSSLSRANSRVRANEGQVKKLVAKVKKARRRGATKTATALKTKLLVRRAALKKARVARDAAKTNVRRYS